jgi:short-subunit dehydrogenase
MALQDRQHALSASRCVTYRNCPFTTAQGSWDSPNWKARCITSPEEGIMSSSTSPEEVVDKALRVLARGGGLSIPGALNKFSVFAQRLIPSRVVPMLVAKLSKA